MWFDYVFVWLVVSCFGVKEDVVFDCLCDVMSLMLCRNLIVCVKWMWGVLVVWLCSVNEKV